MRLQYPSGFSFFFSFVCPFRVKKKTHGPTFFQPCCQSPWGRQSFCVSLRKLPDLTSVTMTKKKNRKFPTCLFYDTGSATCSRVGATEVMYYVD